MPKINGKSYKWVIDKGDSWTGHREWPGLETTEGDVAGFIKGDQSYDIRKAKETDLNLSISIYDWSENQNRKTRTMARRFSTLKEAKDELEKLVRLYPNFAYNPRSVLGMTR